MRSSGPKENEEMSQWYREAREVRRDRVLVESMDRKNRTSETDPSALCISRSVEDEEDTSRLEM